jgi:hypothetical protein
MSILRGAKNRKTAHTNNMSEEIEIPVSGEEPQEDKPVNFFGQGDDGKWTQQ